MIELCLGLDLGSDTLKIAYAYKSGGKNHFGKLIADWSSDRTAVPAVAFYNESSREWSFGYDVGRGSDRSFVNVVKIKSLLSLLKIREPEGKGEKALSESRALMESNASYYFRKTLFPKFYFPVRRELLADFRLMERNDRTFSADETPQQVCRAFFEYLKTLVDARVAELSSKTGLEFSSKYSVAAVIPPNAGSAYSGELSDLIRSSFGSAPKKIFSSTKALSMFARRMKILNDREELLLFDMGEEQISVAKTFERGGSILVDGNAGHNRPISLGGDDVDEGICAYLEQDISKRETMGTPSYGEEGHIREDGLHSKQYLLMKDVKRAKAILSLPLREDSVFQSGVPISICRDLYIQRKFTKEEFLTVLGIGGKKVEKTCIAARIVDYIVDEIKRPANRNVKKIFLSGGLVETYGLLDFIKKKLHQFTPNVSVHDYDQGVDTDDGYSILSNEDSVYAASVGAAFAVLYNEKVETALSYSYGTWCTVKGTGNRHFLKILVDRGTVLAEKDNDFGDYFTSTNMDMIEGEEMFSTLITEAEIRAKTHSDVLPYHIDDKGYPHLEVGLTDSEIRKKAVKTIDLDLMAGGKDGGIYFYYRSMQVRVGEVGFFEGIRVSPDGDAEPYLRNTAEADDFTEVTYLDNSYNRRVDPARIGRSERVKSSEIEVKLQGVDAFRVSVSR